MTLVQWLLWWVKFSRVNRVLWLRGGAFDVALQVDLLVLGRVASLHLLVIVVHLFPSFLDQVLELRPDVVLLNIWLFLPMHLLLLLHFHCFSLSLIKLRFLFLYFCLGLSSCCCFWCLLWAQLLEHRVPIFVSLVKMFLLDLFETGFHLLLLLLWWLLLLLLLLHISGR